MNIFCQKHSWGVTIRVFGFKILIYQHLIVIYNLHINKKIGKIDDNSIVPIFHQNIILLSVLIHLMIRLLN